MKKLDLYYMDLKYIRNLSKVDDNNQFMLIGILNINNMIPVSDAVITKIDLTIHKTDTLEVKQSKTLMQKQLSWCRNHVNVITNRAQKVYDLVVNAPDKNRHLTKRSSRFKSLEIELEKFLNRL